jgi:hypothetical protein
MIDGALERIKKAFALAFSARGDEQRAAWLGVMRLCLQQGWTSLDQMLGALGTPVAKPERFLGSKTSDWQNQPYGWDTVMPFGKHRGETLGVIARIDHKYIEWLHGEEVRSTQLRRAVASVHEWLEENPPDED